MKREDLLRLSEELTAIGDTWRAFAYSAARLVKARTSDLVSYDELSAQLRQIGEREKDFFKRLVKVK
jgi:hypothetical protein